MTLANEVEETWRKYFRQYLNGGEMRWIEDGESRSKKSVSEDWLERSEEKRR